MPKLPVFTTIGHSYAFVCNNLGLIFRLACFPFLISIALAFLPLAWTIWSASSVPQSGPVPQVIVLLVYLAQLLVLSILLVAFHRAILFGDRKPGTFLLFSVGRAEVIFAAVPVALLLVAFSIGVFAYVVLGLPTGQLVRPSPALGPVTFLAFLAIWALGIWASCRFVAFYPFVVVTERLAFREAWRLSRGSFWRIFGVFFLGALPIVLIVMIAGAILMMFLTLGLGSQANAIRIIIPISVALNLVVGIPLAALGVAFLCYCYKALAGYAPDEIVPPTARHE